jgi:hypothetical protein
METMTMSRQTRLQDYKRQRGPKGQSNAPSNLNYWSNRASENSYHGGKDATRDDPDLRRGRSDRNNVGSSNMPNTRREA